jgi:phosphoribosyl 1,2-cyclic phosphodiesterase
VLVRFWGTRGSIAKPGPNTLRYGGNTSCVEVRSDSGELIVLDCGTGAHGLGQALVSARTRPLKGSLLISHTHWDHIQGIPFFAPLFMPGDEWDIYAPRGLHQSLRETLAGQMQYDYFPITLEALGANIQYHDLVEGSFDIGDVHVTTHYLNHPALTLGYRLEADGVSVVYACDHEPASRRPGPGAAELEGLESQHVAFLQGADLVLHDAQFTAADYAAKTGWGHSTVEYAVAVAEAAGARRLALTHHDPGRDDRSIDQIVARVRADLGAAGSPLDVFAAAEGQTIELSSAAWPAEKSRASDFRATATVDSALEDHSLLVGSLRPEAARIVDAAAAAEHIATVSATGPDDLLAKARALRPSLIVLDETTPQEIAAVRRELANGAAPAAAADRPMSVIVTDDKPGESARRADRAEDWLIWPFSKQFAQSKIRSWVLRETCRWMRARNPEDEEKRLAVLHRLGILDTAPEERFDRITRIAADAFGVPIAFVSLVDRDRQWFKSRIGVTVTETPREVSLCAHAILLGRPLIVTDTHQDVRFADNPLVVGDPLIRFYAGAPLRTKDGAALGSLCVIDTRPRQVDSHQIRLLQDLAGLVMAEIEP